VACREYRGIQGNTGEFREIQREFGENRVITENTMRMKELVKGYNRHLLIMASP
jgi:hypothetical protein